MLQCGHICCGKWQCYLPHVKEWSGRKEGGKSKLRALGAIAVGDTIVMVVMVVVVMVVWCRRPTVTPISSEKVILNSSSSSQQVAAAHIQTVVAVPILGLESCSSRHENIHIHTKTGGRGSDP